MEFVRPGLGPQVMPAAVDYAGERKEVMVAGWPIACQHPMGEDSTVFVTIEDETGVPGLVLWPQGFHRSRRQPGSYGLLARGTVSRWDGRANVTATAVHGIHPRVPMPAAHDWR